MSRARGIGVAGAAVLVAAVGGLLGAAPAGAENLGPGWDGSTTMADGAAATGAQLVIPVAFSGPPGYEIVRLTARLEPTGADGCAETFTDVVGTGDGSGSPPGPATPPSTAPDSPFERDDEDHTFQLDASCNGVYDLFIQAVGDPPGPGEPGDPGTTSQELMISDVSVSLAPPAPSEVGATIDGNRRVTVSWQAPSTWAGALPDDARGYSVWRSSVGGGPVTIVSDTVSPTENSIVDDGLVAAPGGRYVYRVAALRTGAGGTTVASAPGEASLDVADTGGGSTNGAGSPNAGGTATPGTSVAAAGRPGGVGTGTPTVALPGQPTVGAPVVTEPGFQPELDYSDAELGEEQAVPPGDAGLFEVTSEGGAGNGLIVPGAVAICLAVWAGHLRHLAHRAAPPPR